MRSPVNAVLAVLAVPLLALAGCGAQEQETVLETVTTTVPPSSTSETTESSSPTSEAPADAAAGGECGAWGFTGAPGQEAPHCLDKQIASCGDATMQTGTTFFTDGTSGWTQYCQDQMVANPPATPTFDQDAYNEQFAEEYWRTHPTPTFDPDSADGYGPDQEIPPACLRFEDVDC